MSYLKQEMVVKFKKVHPNAKLPAQGKLGDAAFDLSCVEGFSLLPGETKAIPTGLVLADMPDGINGSSVFLHVVGRSSLALQGIFPIGGIIDPTYRGEIRVILHNGNARSHTLHPEISFKAGDRIAQLLIQQIITNGPFSKVQMVETDEVSATERGSQGFGSTGK